MDRPSDSLWYFAYGSNLDPGTFLGRRGMRPRRAVVGELPDFRLVFDLPVGPGERGVANLLPEPDTAVWGVAYQISASRAEHLDRTEGVPRAYRRVEVGVRTEADASLAAFTYVCPRRTTGRKPSRRYLGLILAGARHHGLPAEYVHWLRGLELAVDERSAQLELFDGPGTTEP